MILQTDEIHGKTNCRTNNKDSTVYVMWQHSTGESIYLRQVIQH